MTDHSPHPPGTRTAPTVVGVVAVVLAAILVAAGALALWGESKKGADGYLSTGTERFTTPSRALASERLDVEVDDKHWIAGVEDLGDSRLEVTPAGDRPVFAGIAPERDVQAYLAGVDHTLVTDIDSSPFTARHRERHGSRTPAPPAEQDIWAASVQGTGTQTLHWTPDEGDWSVVVMNADGTAGVAADVSAGAEIAFLGPLGWSLAGGGVLLLVVGVGLITLGMRPRTRPRPAAVPVAS